MISVRAVVDGRQYRTSSQAGLGRDDAKLTKRTQPVLLAPLLDDLAISYLYHADTGPPHGSTCGRYSEQLSGVRTGGIPAKDCRIALGRHVLKREVSIRHSRPKAG
jgi:hypothetical protein